MNSANFPNRIEVLSLILAAAVLGGGAGVFAKIALREVPPFSFTFLRFFLALIFLLPFSLKHLPKFDKNNYKIILLSLLASANVILFAFGIKHTTADISQMIYTAVPIISAVLSYYFLKEKFGTRKITGIIIGFIGTAFIIALPLISKNNYLSGTVYGNLTIVIAAISISLYWVLSKKFQTQYSSLEINNYFIFTTTIIMLGLSMFDLSRNPTWWHVVSLNAYLALFFVATLGTALYYLISQIVVKKASPVTTSMILYIQPFATFVWSYLFLSETLSLLFIIGAALSLLGVGIYNFTNTNKFNV